MVAEHLGCADFLHAPAVLEDLSAAKRFIQGGGGILAHSGLADRRTYGGDAVFRFNGDAIQHGDNLRNTHQGIGYRSFA